MYVVVIVFIVVVVVVVGFVQLHFQITLMEIDTLFKL